MMRAAALIAGAVLLAQPAAAQEGSEAAAVALFQKTCVTGELTAAAREAAIAADAGWEVTDAGALDMEAFATVPSPSRNFDYSDPTSVKHWTRRIDGQLVHAILATFPAKRRYPNLCAVIVPGVKNAMPYGEAFREAAKAAGLKGKSTDLPHYYEYSGKPQKDRPVRAEIFSRSQVVAAPNAMHMYIAF
jgi:hypothetical protein